MTHSKDTARALRRHHVARLKKARRLDFGVPPSDQDDPRRIGRHVTTPAACSCWMCGNPRRFFKDKTVQEKIWDGKLREEREDDTGRQP
jgi:hypothetical protein